MIERPQVIVITHAQIQRFCERSIVNVARPGVDNGHLHTSGSTSPLHDCVVTSKVGTLPCPVPNDGPKLFSRPYRVVERQACL